MPARRLFVPPERLGGSSVTLTGSDYRYLARVLRAQPGQEVIVFDGAGEEVVAHVDRIGPTEIELRLGERRRAADAAAALGAAPIVLLAAVPRGGRMDVLIQKTSELGVARIVPVLTTRSVARPEVGRRARWEKIAREAARQCERADVPALDAPVELAAALQAADLPELRIGFFERHGDRSLGSLLAEPRPTALLVGPEGGFTESEMDAARTAGFVAVGLGPRILRAETAAIVAVALVQHAYGGLG
jgi:16S rRNA (uracil1498-N3)-methyltransferase